MRIGFIGSEALVEVPFALAEAGHDIVSVFGAGTTRRAVPRGWADLQRRTGVKVTRRPVQREDLVGLENLGVDLVISAGYPSRLPVRPGDAVPSVNIHPSPLPEGRGPRPIEWAILTGRDSTAVSVHEMTEKFDAGPVLLQRELPIGPRETSASLDHRCRALASQLALELVGDFASVWANRQPQGKGTYCHVLSQADRTLDPHLPVVMADRVMRVSSPGNMFLVVEGRRWVVFDAVCWTERHGLAPGTQVAIRGRERLFAADGGYILIRRAMPERAARLRYRLSRVLRLG